MTHMRHYLSLRCGYLVAWAFILTQLWLLELLARSRKGALGNSIPSQQKDHRFLQVGQGARFWEGDGQAGQAGKARKRFHPFLC